MQMKLWKIIFEKRRMIPFHDTSSKPRNAPHLFNSLNDTSRPFGLQESNLKSLYLTREQLNARKFAPVIN